MLGGYFILPHPVQVSGKSHSIATLLFLSSFTSRSTIVQYVCSLNFPLGFWLSKMSLPDESSGNNFAYFRLQLPTSLYSWPSDSLLTSSSILMNSYFYYDYFVFFLFYLFKKITSLIFIPVFYFFIFISNRYLSFLKRWQNLHTLDLVSSQKF